MRRFIAAVTLVAGGLSGFSVADASGCDHKFPVYLLGSAYAGCFNNDSTSPDEVFTTLQLISQDNQEVSTVSTQLSRFYSETEETVRLLGHVEQNNVKVPVLQDISHLPDAIHDDALINSLSVALHPELFPAAQYSEETYHLFRPELINVDRTNLLAFDANRREHVKVIDLGSSYVMILVKNPDGSAVESIHIVDRWPLPRLPFHEYISAVLDGFGAYTHPHELYEAVTNLRAEATKEADVDNMAILRLSALSFMHLMESIDHSAELVEVIGNKHVKHYHEHHGAFEPLFMATGTGHLLYSIYEWFHKRDLHEGAHMISAIASFTDHHMPEYLMEKSIKQLLEESIASTKPAL